jgi:hypothetical protein
MARIEDSYMAIVKPRRLITIMNVLTNGPMKISQLVSCEETTKAKYYGMDLGFLQIDDSENMIYLTADGYSWLLRNGKIL